MKEVVPYKEKEGLGKKDQVAEMFNNISKRYDFLNHFLSLGIDIYWRKKAIKHLLKNEQGLILDVATGTGDLAIAALKSKPQKVIGVDISEGMLAYGQKKIEKKNLTDKIELQLGDSEGLLHEDNKFSSVIVAFGVRNFENLEKGLTDMYRVLQPGGKLVVLEFSKPTVFPFKQIYNFYFNQILPRLGKVISKDNAAYTYLPESVKAFPDGKKFTDLLTKIGYQEAKWEPLTLGISSIYTGIKK